MRFRPAPVDSGRFGRPPGDSGPTSAISDRFRRFRTPSAPILGPFGPLLGCRSRGSGLSEPVSRPSGAEGGSEDPSRPVWKGAPSRRFRAPSRRFRSGSGDFGPPFWALSGRSSAAGAAARALSEPVSRPSGPEGGPKGPKGRPFGPGRGSKGLQGRPSGPAAGPSGKRPSRRFQADSANFEPIPAPLGRFPPPLSSSPSTPGRARARGAARAVGSG